LYCAYLLLLLVNDINFYEKGLKHDIIIYIRISMSGSEMGNVLEQVVKTEVVNTEDVNTKEESKVEEFEEVTTLCKDCESCLNCETGRCVSCTKVCDCDTTNKSTDDTNDVDTCYYACECKDCSKCCECSVRCLCAKKKSDMKEETTTEDANADEDEDDDDDDDEDDDDDDDEDEDDDDDDDEDDDDEKVYVLAPTVEVPPLITGTVVAFAVVHFVQLLLNAYDNQCVCKCIVDYTLS